MALKTTWPEGTYMRLIDRARLRDTMTVVALSTRELAFLAGCSKGMVDHLLAGRKRTCTPELAVRIAWALRVPLDYLFEPKIDHGATAPVGDVAGAAGSSSLPGVASKRSQSPHPTSQEGNAA